MNDYSENVRKRKVQGDHLEKSGPLNFFIWMMGCFAIGFLFFNPKYIIPGALENEHWENANYICKSIIRYEHPYKEDDCISEVHGFLYPDYD